VSKVSTNSMDKGTEMFFVVNNRLIRIDVNTIEYAY